MRILLLPALLACAPALSLAQEGPVIDPATTDACLASASDDAARRACIGTAAEACMATAEGQSTVGMVSCLTSERDYWDARRDTALSAVLEAMRKSDEELRALGSAAPAKEPLGTDAEAAWMVWKQAECVFAAAQFDGGTGAGPAAAGCDMQLTAERALALEAFLAGPE